MSAIRRCRSQLARTNGDGSLANTPPRGPGRTCTRPLAWSSRIASLTVATATPKRSRRSSLVPTRSPARMPPSRIRASSRRASASARDTRESSRSVSSMPSPRIKPIEQSYSARPPARPSEPGPPALDAYHLIVMLFCRQRPGAVRKERPVSQYQLQKLLYDFLNGRVGAAPGVQAGAAGDRDLTEDERAAASGADVRRLYQLGVHPVLINAFARAMGYQRTDYASMLSDLKPKMEARPRRRSS